jgi:hypothetical protein
MQSGKHKPFVHVRITPNADPFTGEGYTLTFLTGQRSELCWHDVPRWANPLRHAERIASCFGYRKAGRWVKPHATAKYREAEFIHAN